MNTSAPVLAAHQVTKHYDHAVALAGVSLAFAPGESVAIMGPSGSGKTTLLHCLAGLTTPDSGRVLLHGGGVDVTTLDEAGRTRLRREGFGFVFQEGLLLPELSAEENIAIAAMLNGVTREAATAQAREWLARLGLAGHETKRIGQLSGGQAQRVAIARSQVSDPTVTFADEPTGALDSTTSHEVLQVLLRATVGRGKTLIMVTHDEGVAAVCSRLVRLADGRVVHDSAGSPAGQPGEQPPQTQPPVPSPPAPPTPRQHAVPAGPLAQGGSR